MTTAPSDRPVAIITGAGSGIGRATALGLAGAGGGGTNMEGGEGGEGYNLVLAARTQAPLDELASALSCETLVQPTDVARPDHLTRLVEATLARFGRIDALVNNAGLAELNAIGDYDDDSIERLYRVNAMAPAWLIAKVWPTMAAQKRGCIINVSTIGTSDPYPGFFGYACAKASTNLMALSCANEGKDLGIRAFAIAPGAVETPMLRSLFGEGQIPTEQCLKPEQVAEIIIDCIAGRRDDENGRTIYIPGP